MNSDKKQDAKNAFMKLQLIPSMWVGKLRILWSNLAQYLLCHLSKVPCTTCILCKNSGTTGYHCKKYWHVEYWCPPKMKNSEKPSLHHLKISSWNPLKNNQTFW